MLARTLTPETIQKLESLTCDQILVLSCIAKSLRIEAIAYKWGMSHEKVWRIDGEIREILGDDAGTVYREYGRVHGFTEEGKGSLKLELRKTLKNCEEVHFEVPEPDASVMADRICELAPPLKALVKKIREGINIDSIVGTRRIGSAKLSNYVSRISPAVGVLSRGTTNKAARWKAVEKRLRELDPAELDL